MNGDLSSTHESLLEAARAGDRKALGTLLEQAQPHVWRFGMKMCGNPEDAKDVLQETLLAAARNLGEFRGGSSLSTWLYSIARSFCIKKRRRSKFAPEREHSLDSDLHAEARALPDERRGPDEALAGRQLEAALEAAIDALAPMYREVLVLRDVEGLTAPEVAKVLGLKVEAVKSRLHRARLSVRERIAPLLGIVEVPAPGCPDVLQLLSRHLEGEISPSVCTEMEAHVASCAQCGPACDSLRRTLALCAASPAPKVPADVRASIEQALGHLLASR